MESHYINALGFACESQTTLLFYLFCQYSLCVSLSLTIYVHIYTSEILSMKLWKIINLKTPRKNENKLKRIKVTSISEQAGNICVWGVGRGSVKRFFPEKTSTKTSEWAHSWKVGRFKPPNEVQGVMFEKIGNSCLLDTRKSNFPSFELRD